MSLEEYAKNVDAMILEVAQDQKDAQRWRALLIGFVNPEEEIRMMNVMDNYVETGEETPEERKVLFTVMMDACIADRTARGLNT
jgi:hypothetical protein